MIPKEEPARSGFGGCSPEYPVSLKSAYAVLNHINTDQYKIIAVGITKDGKWLRYLGEYEAILNDGSVVDLVVVALFTFASHCAYDVVTFKGNGDLKSMAGIIFYL